ncbi:ABC transporter ATP-binding protein [Lacisediminihabitans changchengi]|uniref:ABC transporter ATP-binding protein n=1 Tax=Lacisediminihabitans changchengi TaxID=2787634 RepID=A0A934SMX2_9MICO|nr:ABC transporter ATP-binding protein [Lacisediminihabitans changchengi]MBK4348310.1 ABC transporter ATP-binding protein [Lacisediminihabitans changchengi]
MTTTALRASGVSRVFGSGNTAVYACSDVSLELHAGELVVLRGRSGSGKSTLLNLLGGLDIPTSGEIWWGDDSLTGLTDDRLTDLRRGRVGFVFQSFGLVPVLSAAENVAVPLRIAGIDPAERDDRVRRILALVGLDDHTNQRPTELSGGQQQRVALARALVIEPKILIADEPTGQLDSSTASEMMSLINSLVEQRQIAAIISTHDPLIVAQARSVIELHDGRATSARRPRGRHAASVE